MRILLVQPPPPPDYVGFRRTALPEPMALECIGAVVCADHDVQLLDMRLDPAALEETFNAFQPDVVAVTCLTTEVYNAQDVLKQVKGLRPGVFTVVGGLHASLLPTDFQHAYVDAIVIGEGEATFRELIETLGRTWPDLPGETLGGVSGLAWRNEGGTWTFNRHRALLESIDALPLPARHLAARYASQYFFLFDQPHACIATSRGCPFRCNFCSVWKFYHKRCRYMSAERVVDELETVEPHAVSFVDDNFLAHVPRAWKILELIKNRGIEKAYGMQARTDTISKHPDLLAAWREVGLETVLIGFEAATQEQLDAVAKGATIEQNERAMDILTRLGVHMWGAFIVDPQFTREDFRQLKTYREEKGVIYPQFTVLTPLPGTDLYEQRKHELVTTDYRLFDALHAVLPTRLPREEFYKEFAALYRPDNPGLVYDWISSGRITMERARKAREILMELGNYENFLRGERAVGLSAATH
ncbi:MAG: cobalamin B12-binding domain-containing protein [Acidobacteria bacterium]|nr:cobalamin B12-binding domain-containing protein [Acidobacteriota bacterium]